MGDTDMALALAIALLVGAAGFLAIAETSLIRMTPTRAAALVAGGRPGARSLQDLVAHPDRFLNTVLLLALGCQLVAATLVGLLADRHLGAGGIAAATTVEVVAVFVLAEAAPKSWAVVHRDRAALLAAPVATLLAHAAPLRGLSSGLLRIANALLPGPGHPHGPLISEAELLATADAAAAERVIEIEEREFIHSVISFGDAVARDVMVARTDMVMVDAQATIPEALELVTASALSRLPAIDGDADHIAGLLYAKDLLAALAAGNHRGSIRPLLRPAPAVPATMPTADLLREMQAGRYHMVVLTDQDGGTAGLVTIEDLLEELVGEIEDEHDTAEPAVQLFPGGGARVSGRLLVSELAELMGMRVPEGNWVTVAGLVAGLLGHIPTEGESVHVDGYSLVVELIERNRIRQVAVTPTGASTGVATVTSTRE